MLFRRTKKARRASRHPEVSAARQEELEWRKAAADVTTVLCRTNSVTYAHRNEFFKATLQDVPKAKAFLAFLATQPACANEGCRCQVYPKHHALCYIGASKAGEILKISDEEWMVIGALNARAVAEYLDTRN